MKEKFKLTPELFKELLESDKESFIAKFNREYYLSALAIECIFPLLPDDETRKKFFLASEVQERESEVLKTLNLWFSAFDFLFENKKYEMIIKLGYHDGARYLYQKGFKDYLLECARKDEDVRCAVACALYEGKDWLSLEGYEKELGLQGGLFAVSGVLAVQEKYGRNIKGAMPVVYQGVMDLVGGPCYPSQICDLLSCDVHSYIDWNYYPAWVDRGKIPDAESLLIWYYKNIGDEQFKAEIVQLFARDGRILAALKNPNFPTKLAEIEKALND